MNHFDPLRPRLPNGTPCWRSAPNIALPRLSIRPANFFLIDWTVQVMAPTGNNSFSWAYSRQSNLGLHLLLQAWHQDPEEALRVYFNRDPPTQTHQVHQTSTTRPPVNPSDIGL